MQFLQKKPFKKYRSVFECALTFDFSQNEDFTGRNERSARNSRAGQICRAPHALLNIVNSVAKGAKTSAHSTKGETNLLGAEKICLKFFRFLNERLIFCYFGGKF
jgi:hypothetical protein